MPHVRVKIQISNTTLCSTPFACEADARQALAAFAQDVPAPFLSTSAVHAQPGDGQRGRPGRDAQPDQVIDQIAGAVASSLATRHALVAQHRGFILATNELDATSLPPHEVVHGYTGHGQAERGCRFLQDP